MAFLVCLFSVIASIGQQGFILEEGFSVIPLEVKIGEGHMIHSAFTNVTQNPEYEIEAALSFRYHSFVLLHAAIAENHQAICDEHERKATEMIVKEKSEMEKKIYVAFCTC